MKYIIYNPKIMGGEPVVVGTRIPIGRILILIGEGYTFEEISKEFYPHVSAKTLKGAVLETTSWFMQKQNGKAHTKIQTSA